MPNQSHPKPQAPFLHPQPKTRHSKPETFIPQSTSLRPHIRTHILTVAEIPRHLQHMPCRVNLNHKIFPTARKQPSLPAQRPWPEQKSCRLVSVDALWTRARKQWKVELHPKHAPPKTSSPQDPILYIYIHMCYDVYTKGLRGKYSRRHLETCICAYACFCSH